MNSHFNKSAKLYFLKKQYFLAENKPSVLIYDSRVL